jgi:hypothetical protein
MKKFLLFALAGLTALPALPVFGSPLNYPESIRLEGPSAKGRPSRLVWTKGDARAELNLRTGRIDLSRDGIPTHDPQLLAEFREEVKKQMPHDEELSNAVVDSRQVVAALGL